MTAATFRPLLVAENLLNGTIWFSIPPNHPTDAIKLKDYCSKLKTNITILDAMVAYCQSHVEKLNDKTLTTFNILEHYGINELIFSNFCKTVEGSTYVKGTQNTKINSLSKQACGVLDRMIKESTNIQQIDNNFEFGCHFGGLGLLSTLLHSFPCQLQPVLHTDLVILDTVALKK